MHCVSPLFLSCNGGALSAYHCQQDAHLHAPHIHPFPASEFLQKQRCSLWQRKNDPFHGLNPVSSGPAAGAAAI